MKKTFYVLLAAGALSQVMAEQVTLSPSGASSLPGESSYPETAMNFTLDSSWLNPQGLVLPEFVELSQMKVSISYPSQTEPLGVVIYELRDDDKWHSVAKSSNWLDVRAETGDTCTLTFEFANTRLSSTQAYAAAFYAHRDTFDSEPVSDVERFLNGYGYTEAKPFVGLVLNYFDGIEGQGGYAGSRPNNYTETNPGAYDVSFTVAWNSGDPAEGVPEPTTATLGLLGLAGLMLRRRRAA